MNTLSDLRSTLDDHAGQVHDGEAVVRSAAVRHRVAVVRRRRRAVGAGALALVTAVTLGTIGLQRASSTPPPVVFGTRAPETLTALGYTYRTDGTARTFDGHGSLKITASPAPRLYTWTTDRPGTVRLVLPDGEVWHSSKTRFGDYVTILPGETGTLRVSVPSGSVGLASYTRTDAAPAGYTKDGSTFRRSVAGTPLLAAAISDMGQPVVRTTYVATGGQVDLHLACSGLPRPFAVNVSLNGDGRVSSSSGTCDIGDWVDPGASGFGEMRDARAGTTVHVRVWVSTGLSDGHVLPASDVPHLRMGIGVYGPAANRAIGGYQLPTVVEQDGHTWGLATTATSDGAPLRLPASDRDRAAQMAWRIKGHAQVEFRAGSHSTPSGSSVAGGQAAMGTLWVPAGERPSARILHGTGTFGVGLYERLD
jgi:hypothetical protein